MEKKTQAVVRLQTLSYYTEGCDNERDHDGVIGGCRPPAAMAGLGGSRESRDSERRVVLQRQMKRSLCSPVRPYVSGSTC